jgi:hypothetical protein
MQHILIQGLLLGGFPMRKLIYILLILCAVLPAFGSKNDLSLIPYDITAVYSVQLPLSEKAQFLPDLKKKADIQVDTFSKLTGVAIKDDVITVTIAVREPVKKDEKAVDDNHAKQMVYTVIRGKFKEDKVIKQLKKEDELPEGADKELCFAIEEYSKKNIYYIKNGAYAFVFVSDSVLVTGTMDSVKDVLDIKNRKAKYAGRNLKVVQLMPPLTSGTFTWGIVPDLEAQKKNDDNKQGKLEVPGNGVLMQGRGRGWGRTRPNRDRDNPIREGIVDGIRRDAHDYDDLRNLGGIFDGALGMGMEAHLFSMMKTGGKLIDYVALVMLYRFKDKETVNQRALELRRYKELYTNAKGAGIRLPESIGFLKDIEVSAKGTILKTTIKFEKDEFKKLQKQLNNMFAKGLDSKAPEDKELGVQELKEGEEF